MLQWTNFPSSWFTIIKSLNTIRTRRRNEWHIYRSGPITLQILLQILSRIYRYIADLPDQIWQQHSMVDWYGNMKGPCSEDNFRVIFKILSKTKQLRLISSPMFLFVYFISLYLLQLYLLFFQCCFHTFYFPPPN